MIDRLSARLTFIPGIGGDLGRQTAELISDVPATLQAFCRAADSHQATIAQEQPWQSGDVHGDAPRLILGKALVHGAPRRLIIEIDVSEMLPVRVGDKEAFFELFD